MNPARRFRTAHLPPITGAVRHEPEDFVVEEVPLYEPCGEGEHTYLWIEKRGVSTHAAIRLLGKALGRKEREFGYAGLKDARAVTRQFISIAMAANPIQTASVWESNMPCTFTTLSLAKSVCIALPTRARS